VEQRVIIGWIKRSRTRSDAPLKVYCTQQESRISHSIHRYSHQFHLSRPIESENRKGRGNCIEETAGLSVRTNLPFCAHTDIKLFWLRSVSGRGLTLVRSSTHCYGYSLVWVTSGGHFQPTHNSCAVMATWNQWSFFKRYHSNVSCMRFACKAGLKNCIHSILLQVRELSLWQISGLILLWVFRYLYYIYI
jgi:hypothetical protein